MSPDGSSVWKTSYQENIVSRINATTNAVTSINVGELPDNIAVSPDGSSVWVTNAGRHDDGDTVSRINTTTNAVTSITVGVGPTNLAVSPDSSTVWVGTDDNVSVINTTTNFVTDLDGFSTPIIVGVSPDGSSGWVSDYAGDNVSLVTILNQADFRLTATPGNAPATYAETRITVGANPFFGAVSPDGSSRWVANFGDGTVSRINTTTNAVTSITVGGNPIFVAVSPDGSSVFVSDLNGDNIACINTATNTVCTSDPSVVAVTPAVPVVTAATGNLAATGSDLFNPLWLVVALFGLGGGALFVSRRRKTQPHS